MVSRKRSQTDHAHLDFEFETEKPEHQNIMLLSFVFGTERPEKRTWTSVRLVLSQRARETEHFIFCLKFWDSEPEEQNIFLCFLRFETETHRFWDIPKTRETEHDRFVGKFWDKETEEHVLAFTSFWEQRSWVLKVLVVRSKSEGARRAGGVYIRTHTPGSHVRCAHMTFAGAVIGYLARKCLLMREGREGKRGGKRLPSLCNSRTLRTTKRTGM